MRMIVRLLSVRLITVNFVCVTGLSQLSDCSSQSCWGKFFSFRADGSYGHAIHLIDLQLWLLLQNTIFFTPTVLKDFFFWRGTSGHQCRNLMSTLSLTYFSKQENRFSQNRNIIFPQNRKIPFLVVSKCSKCFLRIKGPLFSGK